MSPSGLLIVDWLYDAIRILYSAYELGTIVFT